jgi:uncharacterized protein YggE
MDEQKLKLIKSWPIIVLILSVSVSALVLSSSYRYGVMHGNDISTPTISVSGDGEATSLPDIAIVTFTISRVSPNVKDAQGAAQTIREKVSKGLKDMGISDKDIKTENYTVSPKYSYPQIICTVRECPSSLPKLEGYEIRESVTIKVRKIDQAGDVLALLGKNEVTEIGGPNFSVENDEALVKGARAMAIEKAKAKARETASALGAELGEIKSYSEGLGNLYPYDMMYAKASSPTTGAERVTLSPGESKIKVNVTLVYTLK